MDVIRGSEVEKGQGKDAVEVMRVGVYRFTKAETAKTLERQMAKARLIEATAQRSYHRTAIRDIRVVPLLREDLFAPQFNRAVLQVSLSSSSW